MKKVLWIICFVLSLGVLYSLFIRLHLEKSNRSVEVCISWEDAESLIEHERWIHPGVETPSLAAFFERCRIMGVSSVGLREQSLKDLTASGKVIFFSDAEIEKLKALGLVSAEIVKSNLLWIKKDQVLARRIQNSAALTKRDFKKIGDYLLMENPREPWEKIQKLGLGIDPEQLELLKSVGLSFIYLATPFVKNVNTEPYAEMQSGWIIENRSDEESLHGGFGNDSLLMKNFLNTIKTNSGNIILFENEPATSLQRMVALNLQQPERVVRSHTILPEEIRIQNNEALKSRWMRAVKERSCRFLYYRFYNELSLEENLGLLRELLQGLKSEGFILQKPPHRVRALEPDAQSSSENFFIKKPFRSLRLLLAFFAASFGPLLAIRFEKAMLKNRSFSIVNIFQSWLGAVVIAVMTGLLISALLPDTVFVNGLEVFRGVKICLLLPLVLAGFILYEPGELLDFAKHKVSLTGVLSVGIIFFAAKTILIRSGNFSSIPSPLEIEFRSILEHLFRIRPRFKEFLIGHPLTVLGIYFSLLKNERGNFVFTQLPRLCVWGGAVGLISVVNSFCHLHTPVSISLLRTFQGFWLGGILGAAAICVVRGMTRLGSREPFVR